jgi:hypothetical protein
MQHWPGSNQMCMGQEGLLALVGLGCQQHTATMRLWSAYHLCIRIGHGLLAHSRKEQALFSLFSFAILILYFCFTIPKCFLQLENIIPKFRKRKYDSYTIVLCGYMPTTTPAV